MKLSFQNGIDTIPLVIYRDEINQNNIDYIDTAYKSDGEIYYLYSAVEQKYVVKAEYRTHESIVYAVDRTKINIKRVSEECSEECWVIEGGDMDARLKFDIP
ncbi:MAG: hypothetical protein HC906_10005 [Bacteroidales bacterium]|nr:hypothetical protein [Bacteroidales bacterium]